MCVCVACGVVSGVLTRRCDEFPRLRAQLGQRSQARWAAAAHTCPPRTQNDTQLLKLPNFCKLDPKSPTSQVRRCGRRAKLLVRG